MNRSTKKELRNRGLRVQKTPRQQLREPGILGLLTSVLEAEGPDGSIRKAHKGERI
jgi:hypothetical protein